MNEAHPQKNPWWMVDPMALLSLIAMTIALGTTIRFAPDFKGGSAPGPAKRLVILTWEFSLMRMMPLVP